MSLNTFKDTIWPIRDKLYRFALRIVQNTTEAEDVVQDVLSRLWRTRKNWDQIDNLEAWSMRITRNMALDHLRSRRYRRTEGVDGLTQVSSETVSPLEQVEQQDAMSHIQQLMQELPENQRMVLHLREIEQMSYQEIADLLDMPMTQVKTNLFRGRNKLKTALLKRESYGISTNQRSA
ncbi:RNA polymerase sigma factor [Flavilitoribacter nigricans]|uniref:RNA polymerase sigma factor n=1 Tax=Flavilitoribacter nigricans TaxID=70997 RepID=UPI001472CB95|nr:RNA polymerase sigma factor [Flavilitoribacter nigricans]